MSNFLQEEKDFIAAIRAKAPADQVAVLAKKVARLAAPASLVDWEAEFEAVADRPLPTTGKRPVHFLRLSLTQALKDHGASIANDIARGRKVIRMIAQTIVAGGVAAIGGGGTGVVVSAAIETLSAAMNETGVDAETQATVASTVASVVAASHQSGEEVALPKVPNIFKRKKP